MPSRRLFLQISGSTGAAWSCGQALAQAPVTGDVPVVPAVPASPPTATAPGQPPTGIAPVSPTAPPAAGPLVSEGEPQAVAVGYVNDARGASMARFPSYRPGQHCGACQLYQAGPNTVSGPCTLFAGRQVQGSGWCSSFTMRAG